MKKVDLIKLIEGLEEEAEVLDILKENEDIKALIKPFDVNKITVEDYKKLISENKEIKGYYTSDKDRAVTKGIETFKNNNLQKLIDDELKKKSNEGKTPEQIALEELQAKFDALEKEKTKVELSNKYNKTLTEKGFPSDLLTYVFDENEEGFNLKLEGISALINSKVQNEVQAKLNGGHYVPPKGDKLKTMTRDELLSKGYGEIQQFAIDNPDEYKIIMGN